MTKEQNDTIHAATRRAVDALAELHELTASVPGVSDLSRQIGELTVFGRKAGRGELKTFAELSAEREVAK